MLGDTQFGWLLKELKSSTAKFKVIASDSTLRHSKVNGWATYTFSRHRLFDAIKKNKIGGVYTSGDIHSSHVVVDPESDRVGYPLVEIISSGIANSKTLSFATVDFNTTIKGPTMRVRIIHGDIAPSEVLSATRAQANFAEEWQLPHLPPVPYPLIFVG